MILRFDPKQLDAIQLQPSSSGVPPPEEKYPTPTYKVGDAVWIIEVLGPRGHKVVASENRPGIVTRIRVDQYTGDHTYIVLFGHERIEMFEDELELIS